MISRRGVIAWGARVLFEVTVIACSGGALFAGDCAGPTDLVAVRVTQVTLEPPIYKFEVSNNGAASVFSWSLGDGSREEMIIIPDNIPQRIDSPEGWTGRHFFGHESSHMRIAWQPQDGRSQLAPGKSLRGFLVEMPIPTKRKGELLGPDGKPVRPLDMMRAPFTVILSNGTCVWGRVTKAR